MRAPVRRGVCAEPARAPRFEEKSGAFGRLRALYAAFVKAWENPPFHAASVKPRLAAAREACGVRRGTSAAPHARLSFAPASYKITSYRIIL